MVPTKKPQNQWKAVLNW